jgi:hypothetical protein
MKRASHLGLAALIVMSFTLSAALVSGAARLWGAPPSAGRTLAKAAGVLARAGRAPAEFGCASMPRVAAASSGFSMYSDDADGLTYALVQPGHRGDFVMDSHGHRPDLRVLSGTDRRPLLWFVREGREWVSRDPAVVARAGEILEPLRRNGREMGEVGRAIGARGAAAGRAGGRLGRLGARLAALETRAALEAGDDDDREQLRREADALHAEIEALSERLPARDDAGDAALGKRLRELSRRNEVVTREARVQMRALIESAIRDGKAQRMEVGI